VSRLQPIGAADAAQRNGLSRTPTLEAAAARSARSARLALGHVAFAASCSPPGATAASPGLRTRVPPRSCVVAASSRSFFLRRFCPPRQLSRVLDTTPWRRPGEGEQTHDRSGRHFFGSAPADLYDAFVKPSCHIRDGTADAKPALDILAAPTAPISPGVHGPEAVGPASERWASGRPTGTTTTKSTATVEVAARRAGEQSRPRMEAEHSPGDCGVGPARGETRTLECRSSGFTRRRGRGDPTECKKSARVPVRLFAALSTSSRHRSSERRAPPPRAFDPGGGRWGPPARV